MGLGSQGGNLPMRIGGYALERELGAGGMGTVYLARSRGGRTVAVKVARPELAADPHFRARFRAEVEAARRVGGFHTAPVVDADPDAETPWLATAYIPGPTLSGLLDERGPMDERQLRLLGAALAEALQAIHACGLIHRDLKPGNIIMADDGPRVLDFGIARALESTRLTSTGSAFGTPGFLAPEQAQGLEVGAAADVFALGAVLVAAAGGRAFGEGTPMALMYRSVHEEANLSALPEGLRPIVAACLAKEPGQRPTPPGLLDLFVPEAAPDTAPAPSPAPAAPAPAPAPAMDPPPHPPTFSVPAEPAEPGGGPAEPGLPAMAAVESAATVTAAVQRSEPRDRVPAPARPGRTRTGLIAAGVAGVLLVVGAAGYAMYEPSKRRPSEPLPEAKHMLILPTSMMGGTYVQKSQTLPPAVHEDDGAEGTTYLSASYYGSSTSTFRGVEASVVFGRLKNPQERRDAYMSMAGTKKVSEPRREFRFPGSDLEFSCDMVVMSDDHFNTRCAWADENTAGSVSFYPATSSLELAATETRKIRDDIRKPII
ncbi:serine/threonine-protein kinase [Streptomyces sp. ISL-66]|uniref:serine/threonine-protein kinase n=1 Tax=Streptomyces sp. ISL-66 TaxID=2819186 RepID=UPI0035B00029